MPLTHDTPAQNATRTRAVNKDEHAAIATAIRAETEAFRAADFAAWADCWVQDDRTQDVYITAVVGASLLSGWQAVSAHMRSVFDNGLGCSMVRFGQENLRVSVSNDTAWAVFDGWAENEAGEVEESYETRILERHESRWKIVYASFVRQFEGHGQLCLAVDSDRKVIWSSPGTLEKLHAHPTLTISAGRPRAHRRGWDRALQTALARAARYHGAFAHRRFVEESGGPFRYPVILGETDDGGVAAVLLSVRDNVTYLFIDTGALLERRLSTAQTVFGLSDGQMRIARHIANGEGLKRTAGTIGISVNTARTHLARLYDKTGVSSQTALVRILLSVG